MHTAVKTNPNGGPKICYYDGQGRLLYKQQRINGNWYMFRDGTGAMVAENFYKHDNNTNPNGGPKTCYYDAQGRLQYGQRRLGNYWYMFRSGSGAMVESDFFAHDKITNPNGGAKTCYYDAQGHMLYGEQRINDNTYYFNEISGALLYGIKKTSYANVYLPARNADNGKLIVLDPGHSTKIPVGSEPLGPGSASMKAKDNRGALGVSTRITEEVLNLTVAEQLRDELLKRGYSVAMTRETHDRAISCIERTQVANNLNASAYVRIHANSVAGGGSGAETLCVTSRNPYSNTNYTESSKLSEILIDTYCDVTGFKNKD